MTRVSTRGVNNDLYKLKIRSGNELTAWQPHLIMGERDKLGWYTTVFEFPTCSSRSEPSGTNIVKKVSHYHITLRDLNPSFLCVSRLFITSFISATQFHIGVYQHPAQWVLAMVTNPVKFSGSLPICYGGRTNGCRPSEHRGNLNKKGRSNIIDRYAASFTWPSFFKYDTSSDEISSVSHVSGGLLWRYFGRIFVIISMLTSMW